jgi:2'-deoxynucleoside 5'-phosphate N-hydrolase
MNIYFACSITGGREFESAYREFVDALTADGYEIPTSHLAQSEAIEKERKLSPLDVYTRDVNWIQNCDALIAEVSVPSHGVGYEIGYALQAGKPVLCLYQEGRKISKMITGNPHPALSMESYSEVVDALMKARSFLDAHS